MGQFEGSLLVLARIHGGRLWSIAVAWIWRWTRGTRAGVHRAVIVRRSRARAATWGCRVALVAVAAGEGRARDARGKNKRRSSRDIWRVGDRGAHARRPGGTRASRVSPPGPLATRRSILDLCARRRFPSRRVGTTRASRRSSRDQPRCLHASPQPQTRHGTGPFPPARRAGIPLASSRRTSRDTRSMPSPASSCTLEP